jgi:hypothetical protein
MSDTTTPISSPSGAVAGVWQRQRGGGGIALPEVPENLRAQRHGWFATWRWALVWLTQLVFYGLPWLSWNDRQAILSTWAPAGSISSGWFFTLRISFT